MYYSLNFLLGIYRNLHLGRWIISKASIFSRYFLTSFSRIKSCITYQKFSLVVFVLKKMLADIPIKWAEMMTFFAKTKPFLDKSFSSSNSTEILMRSFYVQNFMTIGWAFQELSCKRPDDRTHWPILECTHFLSTQKLEISFLYLTCTTYKT